MKNYTLLLAIAFTLVGSLSAIGADESSTTRPNVLFVIADDLNCDLGCYGHPSVESPNIDRLAKRGVRFAHAYCQFPLCGPSRASFMCGMYPDQTLIHRNAVLIRKHLPEVQTMSQMFRNNGYQAVRVGKIYHYNVPKDIGNDGHDDPASWDRVINPRGRDKTEESQVFSLRPGSYGGTLSWLAADGTDAEQTDGIAATEAAKLLGQFAENKEPFFLAVGFYRPHTPYVAPKKYFDMYPLEKIVVPKNPEGYLATLPARARETITRKKEQVNLPDKLARQAIQAYYASISLMDAQLGRLLEALDEHGLTDNTIIVFTSDHGYHMGEHGHYQKMTLFENAAHVPLIIAAPGQKAVGKTSEAPVEMIDFYPTLAELTSLEAPKNLSGVSQAPVLDDPQSSPRQAALTQLGGGYSLRTARYRYTEWGLGGDTNELYDHEADPAEMKNLARNPQHADLVAELSVQLRKRIAAAKQAPDGLKQVPGAAGPKRGSGRRPNRKPVR